MYCKKCGNELKDGAMFCNKCGMKIINSNNKGGSNQRKEQKILKLKSLFKSPTFVAGIIIYVIIVASCWSSIGAWSLLAAPAIWILALVNAEFRNVEGRRLYGDKWDNMTYHEQETQWKKDQIIHDISNKK